MTRIGNALVRPSDSMTWTQLIAATVLVLTVAVAWRQVTLFIMREI